MSFGSVCAKLSGSEGAMAAGCVDVSNGGVDDGRSGQAANLGQVGQKTGVTSDSWSTGNDSSASAMLLEE